MLDNLVCNSVRQICHYEYYFKKKHTNSKLKKKILNLHQQICHFREKKWTKINDEYGMTKLRVYFYVKRHTHAHTHI